MYHLKLILFISISYSFCIFHLNAEPEEIKAVPELKKRLVWGNTAIREIDKRILKIQRKAGLFTLETKNYIIKTAVSPKFTAELSVYMDYLYEKLRKAVKGKNIVHKKPEVVIYGNETDFCRKLQSQPGGARGVFYYKQLDYKKKWAVFTIYSFVEHEEEKNFENFYIPILNHEGTHQILQSYAGRETINLFINEGLATYIQFWRFEDKGRRKRAERSEFREDLIEAAKLGQIEPLTDLLSIKRNWVTNDLHETLTLRYGAAESFAAFLIESTIGKKYATTFFKYALTGKDLVKLFGEKKLNEINQQWLHYIKTKY